MCNATDAIEARMVELAINVAGSSGNLGLIPVHNMNLADVPDNGDFGSESRLSGTYRTQYVLVTKTDGGMIPLGIMYGPTQQHHMRDALPDSEYVRHLLSNISVESDNVYLAEPPAGEVHLSHTDERVSRSSSPALPAGEPLPSFDFDSLIADVLKRAGQRDEPAA